MVTGTRGPHEPPAAAVSPHRPGLGFSSRKQKAALRVMPLSADGKAAGPQ